MTEIQLLSHLLRRAGFGAAPAELDQARRDGFAGTLDRLLQFETVPDPVVDDLADVQDGLLDMRNAEDVRAAWLYRMIRTTRPLQERLVLFWHNHFATSVQKVESAAFMTRQLDLFRRFAAGNFRSLLLEVSRDPAMLVWLDGRANRKKSPNENFAREVMELFTIGIGNYTEADVKEVARAFTGWTLRDGGVVFEAGQHDRGEKTVLGRKGTFGAAEVVDILARHEATARRICVKLHREFVSAEPDTATLNAMTAEYAASGFDIRAVLRVMFTSDAFRADAAQWARIKSPVELVVGALRAMPGIVPVRQLPGHLRRMGQDLLAPPTVKGWDGGAAWLSTSTMLWRFNYARDTGPGAGNQPSAAWKPGDLVAELGLDTPAKLVDHLLQRFGPLELSPAVRDRLVEYVLAPEGPKAPAWPARESWDTKVRGAAHLVMSLPEYQLA